MLSRRTNNCKVKTSRKQTDVGNQYYEHGQSICLKNKRGTWLIKKINNRSPQRNKLDPLEHLAKYSFVVGWAITIKSINHEESRLYGKGIFGEDH